MSWKAGEEIMYRGCRSCPVFKNEQLALIKLYEFESKLTEAKSIIEAALKAQRNLPQPQDMKTRLTFEFGDFEKLRAALSLCVPIECETGVEESAVDEIKRYRSEYAEQGNEDVKEPIKEGQ
jgi:hypothetical protein